MPVYLLECLLLFWVPGIALLVGVGRGLSPADRGALWRTLAIMAPLTLVMEFVYLAADIWSFSEADDRLVGLTLWGAPVEEFVFWFGAPLFVLGVYLTLQRRAPAGWLVIPPRPERRARPRRRAA